MYNPISMLQSTIDHLVVTSPSLEIGIKYVFEKLGVLLQPGGQHIKMGTQNALLRLNNSTYLEVISTNPNLPAPNRSRWFELDSISSNSKPKLSTWVVGTNNIEEANKIMQIGDIEKMNRDKWHWLITIPKNGTLINDGVEPLLIQWLEKQNPSSMLTDVGYSLIHLNGYHSKATEIEDSLKSIGFKGNFSAIEINKFEKPSLIAHIQTPHGIVELC